MRAKIARHETLAKIKSLRKPRQNKLANIALQTIQESMTKARPGKRKEGNERKGAKNVSTYHDALMRCQYISRRSKEKRICAEELEKLKCTK